MDTINFEKVEYKGMAVDLRQCPSDGLPEIVLAGRSNVGKSSLVNALTNRKSIARISGTPGKTQAVQYFRVDDRFYLTDLPGYGYAQTSRENIKQFSSLVDDYLTGDRPIRAVCTCWMCDISRRRAISSCNNGCCIKDCASGWSDQGGQVERRTIAKPVQMIREELSLGAGIGFVAVSNQKRSGIEAARELVRGLLSGNGT